MNTTPLRLTPSPGALMEHSPHLEALIAERIHSFDLPALLDALQACGYTDADIEYRSHRTLLSQGYLVHAISFERSPRRRVVITVNLGLLSAQSPLPSFLFKAMDQTAHGSMEDFLAYFDHHLLRARVVSHSPERDEALVGDRAVAEDRLQLLRPRCPSTLHWLCARVFPEAEVKIRRTTQWKAFPSAGLRLGSSALGQGSAVGGFATIPQSGMEVSIFLEDPTTADGIPWASEARRRLDDHILPRLGDGALFLNVLLIMRGHSSHAALKKDSHLAYDPMVGGPERDHVIALFSGNTSQTSSVAPYS